MRLRFVWLAVLGMAGSALGHLIGYLLAHPHGPERAAVLSHSGHGYWSAALTIVAFGALSALVAEVALSYRQARRGDSPATGFVATWTTLCVVQGGLFVLVEAFERSMSGSSHVQIWHEPAFWLALPIQVVVAALVTLVVRGATYVACALARRLETGIAHRTAIEPQFPSSARASFIPRLFASSFPSRAPPYILIA